jgi:signal transduction histidine kinase
MRALLDALRDDRAVVDLGIADVVDAVVNDFRQRCRDVDLQVEIPGREGFEPRPAVRETVYYVLREALHNAARHARASSISVRTRAEPEAVTLEVEDDGRGFDADAREHGHHGLQGMRERAELAGGELEVSSMPGSGTKVSLRIDHPRADDALVTEVP